MLKKNSSVYLFICSILFFYLFVCQAPGYSAASFSDSVSVDAGLKLALGNVKLDEASTDLKQSITLSPDTPEQILLTTTLKNTGSLDGKIGYKIDGNIPIDVAGDITLALYEGDEYIADLELGMDSFLQKNGEVVVIEPGNQKVYSVKVKAATLPSATENIQLSISLSLTQTNAKEPKRMFNDEVTFDPITVVLEADAINSDNGWPMDNDPRWKTDSNTGVRYINELESEIMYFSETKDGTRIKNLDNLSIYIDYGKSNQKWNFKQVSSLDSPFQIKEEWLDGKVRIEVSLDTDASHYIQSTTISDYSYEMKFQFQSNDNRSITFKGALFAKRLLLTSDNADYHNNANYYKDILPVYTSRQGATIRLAYIQDNTYSPLTSLSESTLQLSEFRIRFDLQQVNSMIAKVDKSSNSINVKVADFVSDLDEIKRMSIFITGSSGEELKIERNVKALPIDVNMQIPINWYGIGEGDRIKISSQQLAIHLIEKKQGNRVYYASDPENPPVLYLMNTGNNYFGFEYAQKWDGLEIEEIVYSSDRKVMRITFSLELPDLNLNIYNQKFAFKIPNGIGYIIYYQEMAFSLIPPVQMMTSPSTTSTVESNQVIQESAHLEDAINQADESSGREIDEFKEVQPETAVDEIPEEGTSSDETVGALADPPTAGYDSAAITADSPQPTTP